MKKQITRGLIIVSLLTLALSSELAAQTPAAKEKAQGFSYDASLRSRYEFVDWLDAGNQGIDNQYSFPTLKGQLGVRYTEDWIDLYLQGQYAQAFNLPNNADAGTGVSYRSANRGDGDPGSVSVRQAYAKLPQLFATDSTLLVGRSLYSSGAEVKSANKSIDWLKSKRIADRLIGPFDFTFGRSFDGLRFDYKNEDLGVLTLHASHPTEGGFVADSNKTITDISLLTSAFSVPYEKENFGTGEFQLFYYLYDDERDTIKTDNRPIDVRTADTQDISINNFGAHWVHVTSVGSGTVDGLLWGVLQEGDWGDQDHSAGAFAVEVGYRFEELYGKPWFRMGYNWGSGDSDPTDSDHKTFFQMLPTARSYAMTPFYNSMNMEDLMFQVMWKPHEKVNLRSDLHILKVEEEGDLLYSGGGANSRSGAFGFSGVATKGENDVGTLLDLGVGFDIKEWLTMNLYYGHLFSADLTEAAFQGNDDINYGFAELVFKL